MKNKNLKQKILRPKIIGEKAQNEVLKFEKKRGWEARISKDKNSGYDVYSFNKKNKSQYRCIEVKGKIGNKLSFITLYIKLKEKLGKKNQKNYYIYLVQNIENKPKIKIIEPDIIFKNLKIKKLYVLESKDYRKVLKEK